MKKERATTFVDGGEMVLRNGPRLMLPGYYAVCLCDCRVCFYLSKREVIALP